MVVGICQIRLIIYDTFSLKEKRRILKSIVEKVRNRYPLLKLVIMSCGRVL